MKRVRVAVLMGGPSPERDVSLATGRNIMDALDPARYEVLPVEVSREGRWQLGPGVRGAVAAAPRALSAGESPGPGKASRTVQRARSLGIDQVMQEGPIEVALIAMHGPYGEDGTVQGLLELAGVAYAGSGVLASALAMDKLRSRQLFGFNDIPVPAYVAVTRERFTRERDAVRAEVQSALGYPCVVKPNALGSSIGVTIVREAEGLDGGLEEAFRYGDLALVEEFLEGTEVTCGILEDERGAPHPLPLIEIVPKSEFYSYEAKYAPGGSEHIIPARVPEEIAERARATALRAHQVLGCRDMSRVDMFVRRGQIVVLEVNTIPGMTETSLLPDAARASGVDFPTLLDRLIQAALGRARRTPPA